MRKPFVRLFATILTVCMLLSMLPAVAFAAGDAVALKEWNVTLEDVISVNFSVSIPAGDVAQTQAQITVEDETVTLPALEATVNNGNYVFPVELSASQLSSDIVLSVITAGEQVFTTTKSVREYSGILLNGTYNQAVEQMIKQLLNYGAAAQVYFDYNADNLANAGYETANTQPMITSAPFEMTASGSVPGVVFAGASLLLQSRVAVRFYFDIAGDAQAYTFTIGGKDCQAVRSGDRYYVDATGINPQNYGDLVTVSVRDSQGNQLEVGYSPLNYMVRMYPKADAKLQNLLYAMYCYHLEAVEYKSYVLNAEEPELEELSVEKNVADLVVDRILTEDVSFSSPYGIQVLVPAGVLLTEGAQKLTLKLTQKQESDCNVAVGETELLQAFDIRVEGVSMNNTVPLLVEMIGVLPAGLNKGNLTVFHVENGSSIKMEEVMDIADITAHNQFVYEPLDGALTLSMASFSEFALLSDTVNPWDGKTVDTTWYDPNAEEYVIANADQFAGFAQLSASETETESNTGYKLSFRGKTVKLANDINMGGESYITDENVDKLQFYPIGYNKDGHQSYFAGTFDGDGHTITNIYQNTWMMLGKYEAPAGEYKYYNAGMGLFGAIWNATIKNLTVDNFRCENELGQAGVVALNADGVCTFKNIAITNCKPYTYNNNCAGILARDGGDAGNEFTFENITVDHSNTIGALWGTWDGVCAGIMAGLKEGTKVNLKNCHVAAEIDAYNDVCGNYQYYWYRYSGMLIARIYPTVQDENGYVIPDVSGIKAENCTVNYGDWCNYYYCELVANSIASYTHDHQFSRLTRVQKVDVDGKTITYLDGTTGTVPTSGRANYVVVKGEHSTENATCYHFVNGEVWDHADAGTETVNGEVVPKEDRQHYHLPFGQLFTGSGWGIKNVSHYDGVKGITVHGGYSQEKFSVKVNSTLENPRVFDNANEITLGDLFEVKDGAQINASGVHVNVVPADENSTVSGTYTPAAAGADWTAGKLKFEGTGLAYITIQDYKFCTPTKLLICVATYRGFAFQPGFNKTVFKETAYTHISFDYIITEGKTMNLAVMNKNWSPYYGYFPFTAEGLTGYAGVTTTKLDDGYVHVEMSLADINRLNGGGSYERPEGVSMLYVHGGYSDASGYIDKVEAKYIRPETVEEDWIHCPVDVGSNLGTFTYKKDFDVHKGESSTSRKLVAEAGGNRIAFIPAVTNMSTGTLGAWFYFGDAKPNATFSLAGGNWNASVPVSFNFGVGYDGWYYGKVDMSEITFYEESGSTANVQRIYINFGAGTVYIDCLTYDPNGASKADETASDMMYKATLAYNSDHWTNGYSYGKDPSTTCGANSFSSYAYLIKAGSAAKNAVAQMNLGKAYDLTDKYIAMDVKTVGNADISYQYRFHGSDWGDVTTNVDAQSVPVNGDWTTIYLSTNALIAGKNLTKVQFITFTFDIRQKDVDQAIYMDNVRIVNKETVKKETVKDDLINMTQDPGDVAFMGGSEAVRNTEIVFGDDSAWSVNVKTAASFNTAVHSLNMATGKLSAYFYSPNAVPTNTVEIISAWQRSNAVRFKFTPVGDGWYLGEVYMEDFVYEKEGVTTAGALRVRILGNAIIDCMSFDPDANIGAAE